MNLAKIRVLIAAVLVSTTSGYGEDRCVALIQNGLYNTYRSISGSSSLSQAQSQFCSDYNSYKQSGQAGNLGASYAAFSLSANYNASQVEAVGQAMCTADFRSDSAKAMLNTFASVVDPNVTKAFTACVDNAKTGLMYDLTPSSSDANTLTISAYFQPPVGDSKPQRVEGISINQDANLDGKQKTSCRGDLYTKGTQPGGVTLNANVLAMTCTRSGLSANGQFTYRDQQVYNAPVRIVVNTNLGPIIADLPLLPVSPTYQTKQLGEIIASLLDEQSFQKVYGKGWVLAIGQDVSTSDYSKLTGKRTLPDLRGRFLYGALASGSPLGDQKGDPRNPTVTLSVDQIPQHSHVVGFRVGSKEDDDQGVNYRPLSGDHNLGNNWAWRAGTTGSGPVESTGPPKAVNILPPYASVNYFIRIN
jgi:microcystin-dependent protein